MNINWIKSVCSTDPKRPSLHQPMVIVRDSQSFLVASDGMRLVELPISAEAAVAYIPAPEAVAESLANRILVPTPDAAVDLDLDALSEFAHERVCEFCQGPDVVSDPTYAYVGGVLFNLHKFFPMLSHVADTERVRWYQSGKREQALIDGGEWRFIVMPCNDNGANEHAPRFEIEGAGVFA